MRMGREGHSCAMLGTDVFVIGGELSIKRSIEIWNGRNWEYSIGPIGATNLKIITKGRIIYMFGGWEMERLSDDGETIGRWRNIVNNKIWKINNKNEFYEVGNTGIARKGYALFTLPRGFLTNCQGEQI